MNKKKNFKQGTPAKNMNPESSSIISSVEKAKNPSQKTKLNGNGLSKVVNKDQKKKKRRIK
jgi:hypothetical protein